MRTRVFAVLLVTGVTLMSQPKFKAIWEPINFNKDIDLLEITCTGPKECWAVGNKSTILHTVNGGDKWEVQLGGDPASTDEDLANVFALDNKNVWVLGERAKLLHTSDGGANWSELGKLPGTSRELEFVSAQTGFSAENSSSIDQSTLIRTDDGGKSWKPVLKCMVSATIGGLARELPCRIRDLQFIDSKNGFGVGSAATGIGMGVPQQAVFLRTSDGGDTWQVTAPAEFNQQADSLHAWGSGKALVVLFDGKAWLTNDGGKSWAGVITPLKTPCYYASAGNEFAIGVHRYTKQIAYSTNGAKTFSGRPFSPPAQVNAIRMIDQRNGYIVGHHGMAYRYTIVPVAFMKAGMLDAMAP